MKNTPKVEIRLNRWDNWYGYISGRRVATFFATPEQTQEEQAREWLTKTITQMKKTTVAILAALAFAGAGAQADETTNAERESADRRAEFERESQARRIDAIEDAQRRAEWDARAARDERDWKAGFSKCSE